MKVRSVLAIVLCGVLLMGGTITPNAAVEAKYWSLSHSKGAPSNEGKLSSCAVMKSSSSNKVTVNMDKYTINTKTTIKAYRSGYDSQGKYLSSSQTSVEISVPADKQVVMYVKMSTTSASSVSAEGTFIRK